MKAFTVYQPYAYAIVAGLKGYETRPRRVHIRGRVAVHAGKRAFDGGGVEEMLAWEVAYGEAVKAAYTEQGEKGMFRAAELAFGAVVGTVEIVDCVPVEEIMHTLAERERDNYRRQYWDLLREVQERYGTRWNKGGKNDE